MMRWRPRLAGVLFAVNLLIFLLPLGGIAILRLYESELIRRTETELNVQGAFVVSIYRTELLRHLASNELPGLKNPVISTYGVAIPAGLVRSNNPDDPWTPIEASLDIAKDQNSPASSGGFPTRRTGRYASSTGGGTRGARVVKRPQGHPHSNQSYGLSRGGSSIHPD